MDLIDSVGFDASYSFVYSTRPGTPAADLADDTPHEVKLARLQRLQTKNDADARAISDAMIGSSQHVLAEGVSQRNARALFGRTDNNHVVNFPGTADLIGQFVEITITAAAAHTLRGEIAPAHA
jgi:tRNA-2-methylthio-N6-dimethylallyladenosine synthase